STTTHSIIIESNKVNFTVTSSTPPSFIHISSPKDGDIIKVSQSISARIQVTYEANFSGQPLYYLIDSSGNISKVSEVARATDCSNGCTLQSVYIGVANVTKPGQYKIKICDTTNIVCDISSGDFTITD